MSRFRAQSWTAGSDGETNMLRRNFAAEAEEHLIPIGKTKPRTGPKAVFFTQWKTFFTLVISWILFILYLQNSRSGNPVVSIQDYETDTQAPANLHLVIPASKPDSDLCKVLISAAVNGYPSPVIVNWNHTFNDEKFVDGGSHIAKITGIHDYLSKLDPYQDEDLVLMVDGYDIWLQLRPQTLIDRYYDINRRADEQIVRGLGSAAHKNNIHQEIIFSSQKSCWPWTADDPPCYAVPESSLPADVHRSETDQYAGSGDDIYVDDRRRFINTGVTIGTVRAMRRLFTQAMTYVESERNIGSDQWIFSHILGEQEVWREAVRRDSRWPGTNLGEKLWSAESLFDEKDIENIRIKAAAREDHNLEFNIGLDYEGLISLGTAFLEDDAAWLTWNNTRSLRSAEYALGISIEKSRMRSLSDDITATVPPFWTFNNEPTLQRWTDWTDVPLLTNIRSGNVPAIIHHNAHDDDGKALRKTWWNETWFSTHARTLYDTSVYEPILPIAYSGYDNDTRREYWPSEHWKAGARNAAGPWDPHHPSFDLDKKWLMFADVCNDYHKELWRDGQGEWILPSVH